MDMSVIPYKNRPIPPGREIASQIPIAFILSFAWFALRICIYDQMNQMTAAPDRAAISVKGMPMRTKSLVDTL